MPEEKTPKAPAGDDDDDDLFGDSDKSSDTKPAPAKPAAITDDADDLAAEPADDMPAAADDKDSAKPAGDDFDDLFDDEPKAGAKSAAAQPGSDDKPATADDDLMFDEEESAQTAPQSPAVVAAEPVAPELVAADTAPPAESLVEQQIEDADASAEFRTWTDNTGSFTVRARLVRILDGQVRLQKETGRFTTVPLSRLSKPDLAFVQGLVPTIASNSVDRGAEF